MFIVDIDIVVLMILMSLLNLFWVKEFFFKKWCEVVLFMEILELGLKWRMIFDCIDL